jgi:hypothetical protein
MPCYLFKNTSETFTTTFGPKPCTYQNSIKFQPNSPNPSLSLFFPLLSLQDQLGHTLAGHLSLFPSLILFVPCSWTKGGGSPRQSLPRSHPPSLSHSSHPQPPTSVEPPPRSTLEPHRPVPARANPPLPFPEARGHLVHAHADQGAGVKPAPATTPPEPPSHRRRRPMVGCRPRRPLATL